MTEAEWLSCTDPEPMLEFVRGKVSERKLRLFAVACCRRVGNLLTDGYSRKALRTVERYADAAVSAEKLGFAWHSARRAAQVAHRRRRETAEATALWAVSTLCEADIGRAVSAVSIVAMCEAYPHDPHRLAVARREQVPLLRDVVGNPFHPVTADSQWLTSTAVDLARAIYEGRAFDRLPILADALQDAGCDDEQLLAHCRSEGPHVRGCWAVDLVLGTT